MKRPVTLNLSEDVIQALDELVDGRKLTSRSQVADILLFDALELEDEDDATDADDAEDDDEEEEEEEEDDDADDDDADDDDADDEDDSLLEPSVTGDVEEDEEADGRR